MTIDEMRAILGLPESTPAETVVQLYGQYVLNQASAADLLPLSEIKAALRITTDLDDEMLSQFRLTAIGWVEEYTGVLLSARPVTEQFDGFRRLVLDAWPVNAIVSINYFAADGIATQLADSEYRLQAITRPAQIGRAASGAPSSVPWPTTMAGVEDAVSVTVQAGYSSADIIPNELLTAALVIVRSLYDDREVTENAEMRAAGLCRFHRRWMV